ncbi:MAG: hypothetical protein IJK93_06370 [Muribaculaceae bacterium]|nr:hypothetical protein [Muribaculaceae bacterium]
METQERISISGVLLIIGLLIMAVMALMPLLNINPQWMKWMRWIYAGGAVLVLVARIVGVYNGPSLRIKRLHRILISSGILYCASALMMFISNGTNDWIGFLLAGVMVQLYASWMIEHEEKKSEK